VGGLSEASGVEDDFAMFVCLEFSTPMVIEMKMRCWRSFSCQVRNMSMRKYPRIDVVVLVAASRRLSGWSPGLQPRLSISSPTADFIHAFLHTPYCSARPKHAFIAINHLAPSQRSYNG